MPLDYNKDTLNYINENNPKSHAQIHQLISELDLVDVWRELNRNQIDLHGGVPHKKQGRLDYFLISSDLQLSVSDADIDVSYKSDHSPVKVIFNF